MTKLRRNRRVIVGATVVLFCAVVIFIGAWFLGVRKTLYQANRLISAEPKESTVNLNSVAGGGKEFDHTTFDALLDPQRTRPNSSHVRISYARFCLRKKTIPASLRR